MRINRPESYIPSNVSVSSLRSAYIDNSFLILKEKDNRIYDIINIPFTTCRDHFLVNVHSLFVKGEQELLIGLALPEEWFKNFNERNRTVNKLSKSDVEDVLLNYFHRGAWKVYDRFLSTQYKLTFEIKSVDLWGLTTVEMVLFKIYNQTYIDLTLFWLLTHELRSYLTGTSRTDTTLPEYNTLVYTRFINNLKAGAYISYKDNYTYKYPENSNVLSYHSPLNLLNGYLGFFSRLIKLVNGYKSITDLKERQSIIQYEIAHLKSSFIAIEEWHVNLTLMNIQTEAGSINVKALSKLLKLIKETQ